MSTSGPNFVARMVSRIGRGLRAARRPWVVVVGLLYIAGDLWCIAGRNDWYYSITGRIARAVVFGIVSRTTNYYNQQVFVILPDLQGESPIVLAPDEQSWDKATRLLGQPGRRVMRVLAFAVAPPPHLHARTTTTTDWRVGVTAYDTGRTVSMGERDQAIAAIREWNKTCESTLGLRPIVVDPKRVATIHPLGILHNAMSLGVLVLVVNAVPSVTIGAWRRRRAVRRMARGQCALCGYEFGAASIDRCPECGQARAGGET